MAKEECVRWPVPSLVGEDGVIKRFDRKTCVGAEPYIDWHAKRDEEGKLQRTTRHAATDFHLPVVEVKGKAKIGPPVQAIADGRITYIGHEKKGNNAGNFVILEFNGADGKRYRASYRHLGTIAAGLKVGDQVSAGQTLGETGDTGNVRTKGISHPVLCFAFEKRVSGEWQPVNPYLTVGKLGYEKLPLKVAMNIGNQQELTPQPQRRKMTL